MLEAYIIAFATFFATIGPQDSAIVFAALTADNTPRQRLGMAIKATVVALLILTFFALLGRPLLTHMGISLAAMRTAGGFLLLLIATDMVFARMSGGTSTTEDENTEAAGRTDISVFPLATPLIAGPGAIGAIILLVAEAEGDVEEIAVILGAMASVVAIAFVLMLIAAQVQRVLGKTGVHVITRVLGILLAALAVQFLFDGISESGLLG